MAGKVRYLIQRDGRYHARIVVPKALRSTVGKTELSSPLGADRQVALRRLPASVATLQDQLDRARAKVAQGKRPTASRPRNLDAEEMAHIQYGRAVAFDTELRNSDSRFAAGADTR